MEQEEKSEYVITDHQMQVLEDFIRQPHSFAKTQILIVLASIGRQFGLTERDIHRQVYAVQRSLETPEAKAALDELVSQAQLLNMGYNQE